MNKHDMDKYYDIYNDTINSIDRMSKEAYEKEGLRVAIEAAVTDALSFRNNIAKHGKEIVFAKYLADKLNSDIGHEAVDHKSMLGVINDVREYCASESYGGWMPIETAPKECLLLISRDDESEYFYRYDIDHKDGAISDGFKYWLPLPGLGDKR